MPYKFIHFYPFIQKYHIHKIDLELRLIEKLFYLKRTEF